MFRFHCTVVLRCEHLRYVFRATLNRTEQNGTERKYKMVQNVVRSLFMCEKHLHV